MILIGAAFMLIVYRGMRIAARTEEAFGRFLAFGITLLLGLQAVINMLVAVALIPTKGLTLPFVSYGGSSMLVNAIAVGILLNISRSHGIATVRAYAPPPAPTAAKRKKDAVRRQQTAAPTGWRALLRWPLRKKRRQTLEEVL